jgi:predicted nucleic acid-binding protein
MSDSFLDTSFAIALAAPADVYHSKAIELSDQLQREGRGFVTTHAVLLEIGDAFSKKQLRRVGVEMLRRIALDTSIQILPLSEALYRRAFELYRDRPDKDWGLTDCISFVVMTERGMTDALTADTHFRQAGFRALLLET